MPLKTRLMPIPILDSNTPVTQWQSALRSSVDESVGILVASKLPSKSQNN